MDFFINLKDYLINIQSYSYLILFVVDFIPGAGISAPILGGFLTSIHYLKMHIAIFTLIIAEVLVGISWYSIGYFSGRKPLEKWGYKIKLDVNKLAIAEKYFNKYAGLSILMAKFTYGFTIAVMIIAGVLKMAFKKFNLYNAIGSVGWVSMTFFLGYFFGYSYKSITAYTKNISLFIIFVAGSIFTLYLLKILMQKTVFKFIKLEEFIQKIKELLSNNDER